MPRPLVYGNGRLFIAFDHRHQARDLSWPNVGYPNHLLGNTIRTGIWCDGEFSWCDSDEWERVLAYDSRCLVGASQWRSWKLGLEIEITEAADPIEPVFVRRFLIKDLRGSPRSVRLFQTQNFNLGQSDVGNTVFFNPFVDAIVHYRGPHYAVVTGTSPTGGIDQYATGIKGFGGMEGTWRDAEDGELSGNPIAQGSVDSTFGLSLSLSTLGEGEVWTALVMGHRLDDATERLENTRKSGWAKVVQDARKADLDWLGRAQVSGLEKLPEKVQELFWRSLLMLRVQTDHGGAILAGNDSDILQTNRATYSYCWPRDGAMVCRTLSRLGYTEYAERFVEFCERVMPHDQPFLMQKYRSDGSLGASWHPWIVDGKAEIPFQEDETALAMLALETCEPKTRGAIWKSFGKPTADFLVSHRSNDGLPLPSFDLWEERRGVHFFTVCAVVAALEACDRMDPQGEYRKVADNIVKASEKAFLDPATKAYGRMVKGGVLDSTPDSAVIGGLLLLEKGRLKRSQESVDAIERLLVVEGSTGGFARYEGDYYFRRSEKYPGNPWVISTMWSARMKARLGDSGAAVELLEWAAARAENSGVLAEQYHPETGEPLSVSPLTWSHAEFVETVLEVLAHDGN